VTAGGAVPGIEPPRGNEPLLVTGLLLAGGASRRMGRDKAGIEFEGETLASRAARMLAEVCEEVLVASGDGAHLAGLGWRQVADAVQERGPLGGIVAGLEAAVHPLVAVVAVDMPFASPALLRMLAAMASGQDAVVPVTDRGPQPLHAVYATGAAPAFRAALEAGRLSIRDALGLVRTRFVTPEEWTAADPSGRFAENLNTPQDLNLG
jgi:molybdopterin-guanine dinucleotide biosynthesis protein A